MKHFTALLLLLNLSGTSFCLAQNRLPSYPDNGRKTSFEANYNNVEVVRDLYALHLQEIQVVEDKAWVVAQVTPDSEHSQNTIPQETLDVPEHGIFHILLILAGSTNKSQENYNWGLPLAIWDVANYVKRKDAFVNSAFSKSGQGGLVICRINNAINGNSLEGYQRYDPSYLIPSSYQNYILPAIKFYKTYPDLLNDQKTNIADKPQRNKEKSKTLHALIHNSNPFLAAAALRALVVSEPINKVELQPYLSHLQGVPLALSCYIILKHSLQSSPNSEEGITLLLSAISLATTTDQLNSILMCVHAAELDTAPYPRGEVLTTLLAHLQEKQVALNLDKHSNNISH